MKKLFKLCTIGGMALVIAACGNGEEETDTGDEAATEESGDTATEESGDTAGEGSDDSATEESGDSTAEESSETGTDEEAASGEEQSKTFVLEEEGYVNELVYYYIEDEVQRQTSESNITYEALAVANEEEARELLEEEAASYNDVDGVEQNIEYNEDGIVETLEVDYTEAEISEISSLEGAEFEEEADEAQFISMQQSEEQLLSSGYELVEGE